MIKLLCTLLISFIVFQFSVFSADFEKDIIKTSMGELEVSFIGHGTLMLQIADKTIHIDPYSRLADYSELPKADLILITHHHGDHLDLSAIEKIKTDRTDIFLSKTCSENLPQGKILANGQSAIWKEISIETVPAYNLVHKRSNGQPYHLKGEGNGYILTIGEKRIYIAGDTENTPEMKSLKEIDIAFLPMNLPYTMTPEMVADAATSFKPEILYPYHYGSTDVSKLTELLKNNPEIEVRIRKMQ